MKSGAALSTVASSLILSPLTGVWFRAVQTRFLSSALSTAHTASIPSRFLANSSAAPGPRVLYLAEDPLIALYEVQALLGSPFTPGATAPNPRSSWTILNVNVTLSFVADLTSVPGAQMPLGTTAQELTGDRRGYTHRGASTSVKAPTGTAPTQDLGAALYGVSNVQAFRSLSARVPTGQILIVFVDRLLPGSVSWLNPVTGITESLP